MLTCGIVGLPNVGKSTLFNALLKKQQALAANYPFATIEPNIGIVAVPDKRLEQLAHITKEEEKMDKLPPCVPTTIEFVDIAGLVKGASEGAGLGNKFLSHIREVTIIAQVVRVFTDDNVIREGSSDPINDYQTVQTELMLADLQTIIRQKDSKAVKIDPIKKSAILKIYESLNKGIPVRNVSLNDEERESIHDLFLLSNKKELIVLNIAEEDYTPTKIETIAQEYAQKLGVLPEQCVVISAQIEAELASLSLEEQQEYLQGLGLTSSGLEQLIRKAYEYLHLISFLTAGVKEVRAWTIQKGSTAVEAAGTIHTDFMSHFIKAEVISFSDFITYKGWKKAREIGKARMEGREYRMQDGDIVEFKIGH